MRGLWIAGLVLVLAGCAGGPPKPQHEAVYQDYWRCAYAAAMPLADDPRLTPRQAAQQAQSRCHTRYRQYRDARIAYSRAAVDSGDYELATALGRQSARERRRMVTARLTELVADAR